MLRTFLASALFVLCGYGAAAWLTRDFHVWTAEGARRLAVVRAPVAVPAVALRTSGAGDTTLPALLGRDGGVTIVDFVYTRCQTVCLALGDSFQRMQAALLRQEREAGGSPVPPVRLLSISFDLVHDTPEALTAYANRLHADPRLWRFAAPVEAGGLRLLLERFGVVVIGDGMGGYEHNAALLVIDGSGRLAHIFDTDDTDTAVAFARHLAARGRSG